MKGVGLIFGETGPVFDTQAVEGFAATVQNALVNLGTRQGSDPVFPERGTGLQADAAGGRLVDLMSAQHSANYAASDTVFFTRDFQEKTDPDALAGVKLEPADFDGQHLFLDARFEAADGRTIGVVATL